MNKDIINKTFKQLSEEKNDYKTMSKAINFYGGGLSYKSIAWILLTKDYTIEEVLLWKY